MLFRICAVCFPASIPEIVCIHAAPNCVHPRGFLAIHGILMKFLSYASIQQEADVEDCTRQYRDAYKLESPTCLVIVA